MAKPSSLGTLESVFVHHAGPEIPMALNAEVTDRRDFDLPAMFLTCLSCSFFRLLDRFLCLISSDILMNDGMIGKQPFLKDWTRGTGAKHYGYRDERDQGRNTHGISPASARPGCRAVALVQAYGKSRLFAGRQVIGPAPGSAVVFGERPDTAGRLNKCKREPALSAAGESTTDGRIR